MIYCEIQTREKEASFEEITVSELWDELLDLKAIVDIGLEIGAHLAIAVAEPVASLIEIIDEEHDFTHTTLLALIGYLL